MNAINKIYSTTLGNRCFEQVYNNLEAKELLELDVDVDELLLKLTVIHRLFQLHLSDKRSCEKLHDVCYYLISKNIIRKLISCLEDQNQHVVFMASKAISSLILAMPLCPTTQSQLNGLFQYCISFEWKSIYVMKCLKQVLEACFGDKVHNLREEEVKTLSNCNCSSSNSELKFFSNGERRKVEILEFIVSQDWISVLSFHVPFWKEVFLGYLNDSIASEDLSWTAKEFLEYNLRMNSSIHQKLTQSCFEISTKDEQVLESFLSFLSQFFKLKLRFCWKEHLIKDVKVCKDGRGIRESESHNEILLQKIIPLVVHILHYQKISSEIWKKLLKLISYFLNTSTSSQSTKVYGPITRCMLSSAAAYICAVDCCILDYIPVRSSFESFGGSSVKPVNITLKQPCSSKANLIVFRKASLLVLQASLVLFNSCKKYDNANSRLIFKSINTWYEGLLKIGTSYHSNHEAYQREPNMILMDVFADQDDEMIEVMLLLLKLFKVLSRETIAYEALITVNSLNPHRIFQAFLRVICFDHSVLLDFLISSETLFLEYLLEYLRFVLNDWKGFCHSNCSNLVEDLIATNSIETEAKCSETSHQKGHHSNERSILNPLDNVIASTSVRIKTDSNIYSQDLSSNVKSVGLGGLMDICLAYGNDSDDDDDSETCSGTRESNSDGVQIVGGIEIHGGDGCDGYCDGGDNGDEHDGSGCGDSILYDGDGGGSGCSNSILYDCDGHDGNGCSGSIRYDGDVDGSGGGGDGGGHDGSGCSNSILYDGDVDVDGGGVGGGSGSGCSNSILYGGGRHDTNVIDIGSVVDGDYVGGGMDCDNDGDGDRGKADDEGKEEEKEPVGHDNDGDGDGIDDDKEDQVKKSFGNENDVGDEEEEDEEKEPFGNGEGGGEVDNEKEDGNADEVHMDESPYESDDKINYSSTLPKTLYISAAGVSPMLENVMSTIIHTRIAIDRLNEGSLFPYQVKPLTKLIKKIENIYDGVS